MPGIDVVNVIKVNIHSIGTEQTGGGDNHFANRPAVQREDTKQETDRAEECYTNNKFNNKNKSTIDNQLSNTVEYFLSGLSHDSDKKRSAEITQQLQKDFEDVFGKIGCFDGTFSL